VTFSERVKEVGLVIIVLTPEELESMTDEEVVAAYVAVGISEESGRRYLGVLRNPGDYFID
jgi:hypothetical protein